MAAVRSDDEATKSRDNNVKPSITELYWKCPESMRMRDGCKRRLRRATC